MRIHRVLPFILSTWVFAGETQLPVGWQVAQPTGPTHTLSMDMGGDQRNGKACGRIDGHHAENKARGCFTQEFVKDSVLKTGLVYRYSVSYRTAMPFEGSGSILIDTYTAEGEKGRRQLVSEKLSGSKEWKTISGEVTVPAGVVRTRMLLYLHGKGTIWYDDVFFGEAKDGTPNHLKNGGFEPTDSFFRYDMAPEKGSGAITFSGNFENGTIGKVKEINDNEFYVYARDKDRHRSGFLWFHFLANGCKDKEAVFHVNVSPFSVSKTGGNGLRSPVASYDGDTWFGMDDKSWSTDGDVLTFRHCFTNDHVWIASFFPFTAAHITRFIERHRDHPYFKATCIGKTPQGRDIRMYVLTDPDVPEAQKRAILFTTLQHDLESTGAMTVEGIVKFLLSGDPKARELLKQSVFYVVPMMDVDGIAQGNLYCPVGNMNRQWGINTTPENSAVENVAKDLATRGRKLDLFLDFHGWCVPARETQFHTIGKELTSEADEKEALRFVDLVKTRITGKTHVRMFKKMTEHVTMGPTDIRRLSEGWMKFEGKARLAFCIEIFGDAAATQEDYFAWGRSFAVGMAEFYGAEK